MSALIGRSEKTHRVQEFRTSGTFTVPVGLKTVNLFMIGAGGGGDGVKGGNGGRLVKMPYDVSGKVSCSVLIGAGAAFSQGGNTSFDGVVAQGGCPSSVTPSAGLATVGEDGFGGYGTNGISAPSPGVASVNGVSELPYANSGAGSFTNAVVPASGYCRVEWYE